MSQLETEICSQAEVVDGRTAVGWDMAAEVARVVASTDVTHAVIAARGTSDNAARFAQYLWGKDLRLATHLAAPSLYRDPERAPHLGGALAIGISQSGQSPDIVGVLTAARAQGRPTVAITNDPSSPLAAEADVVVDLAAGPERAVAATKTFTASLHAIVQIAEAISPSPGRREQLDRLPGLIAQAVHAALAEPERFAAYDAFDALTITGRGLGFAIACEAALKIREVAGLRGEAFPVPDLLHGPVAANGPGSLAWVIASPDEDDDYWSSVVDRLGDQGAEVSVLSATGSDLRVDAVGQAPDGLPGWAFAIVMAVHGQVAALRLGERRGRDVDNPVGLTKVTRTA